VLGSNQPKYWKQAIAQFPTHPRTLEIVRPLLKSQSATLLLLLANTPTNRNYLSARPTGEPICVPQLKPEDWEVVGFAYWENQVYPKAGAAYAEAPDTLNIYRTAYGPLDEKRLQAIAAYQQLLHNFPDAKETGTALLQLNMANQRCPDLS